MKRIVSAIILICLVYSLGCGRAILKTSYGTYEVNPWDKLVFEKQSEMYAKYIEGYKASLKHNRIEVGEGGNHVSFPLPAPELKPPKLHRIDSANAEAAIAVGGFVKDIGIAAMSPLFSYFMLRENRKSQEALFGTLSNVFSDVGGNVYDSYNTTTNTTENIDRTVTTNTTETTYGANSGNTGDFHVGDTTRTRTATETIEGSYNQPDNGIYDSYNSTDDNHTEDNSIVRPEVIPPVVPIVPVVEITPVIQ